ncbi:hypothetical protein BDBG_06513 [Blastomyces gilchristii SLH14081]|uniref:Uncharacterized protein n=1 Tax=Blastomyces gilchristii (strain SLH14081) TaxID=559298 RepID=A0A179URP1_BLAGS|nr:uncharacterized protein BDBG_06513 [Blastomyces gilchristii SLH14081]OAT10704.1 hypothetical protein BDBG_06513 [Blastomyces gilchristii SLH14081]
MRPLSVSPAVVNMHGFDPRMDLKIPNKYPGHLTVPRDIPGVCPRSPLSPRTESTERSHYGEPLKGATERSTVLYSVVAGPRGGVGGPAVDRPFYQQALVVIELFCPSSLHKVIGLSYQLNSQVSGQAPGVGRIIPFAEGFLKNWAIGI